MKFYSIIATILVGLFSFQACFAIDSESLGDELTKNKSRVSEPVTTTAAEYTATTVSTVNNGQ